MKKGLGTFLLFGLITIGVIIIVQWRIDLIYQKNSPHKFNRLMKHQIDSEVMIFGSSVAYRQMDPRILQDSTGYTVYNMGWDGVFFIQYEGLLKEFLSYTKKCRMIVMACDISNLGKNELITRPDLFYAFIGNDKIYRSLKVIETKKILLAKYLPGYKMTLYNKNFYTEAFLPHPELSQTDTQLGYEPVNRPFERTKEEKITALYDSNIYARLLSTIKEITSNNIKVLLVLTPMDDMDMKKIVNLDFIREKYSTIASETNTIFIDYTKDTSLTRDTAIYFNITHLNQKGSTFFSQKLAREINQYMK